MRTNMFVSEAMADTPISTSINSILANILPLLIIMVILYFLVIRPQQKKLKDHQRIINGLKKGDKIVTSGGIIGTIFKIGLDDQVITIEIAPDVRIKMRKENIAKVIKY